MPGAVLGTGGWNVDQVLAFLEHTFQWRVERKAFRWQANK